MQNDHDPMRVYDKLRELYEESHAVHVASGEALVEIINALSRKTEADAAFLQAFSHLVSRPMAPVSAAPDEYPSPPPGYSQVQDPFASPPPLPGRQPMPDDDFMRQHIEKYGPPPGGR